MAKEVNVETKIVEMLDALQNGAIKIGEGVVKYSPDVADAALWVVRIDALENIVFWLIFFIMFLLPLVYIKSIWAWCVSKEYSSNESSTVLGLIGLVASFIAAIIGFFNLTTIWNWVAVFEPKLYLAKQIISATLGK